MERSKGTITNGENSGTVGVMVVVGEGVSVGIGVVTAGACGFGEFKKGTKLTFLYQKECALLSKIVWLIAWESAVPHQL